MNVKVSDTCKQLMVGVVAICILEMIVGGIIGFVLTGNWLQILLGILLGGIIALVLVRHMDRSIENALNLDSEGATRYARRMSAIRVIIMIVTLVLALVFPNVFNIIGVLLGILALKFSVYIQPLTSKYISNKK